MNENSEKLNFISNKSIHFKHLTPLPIRNDSLLTSLRNSVKFRSQDIIENSDQTIPLPANNNRRRSTIAHGKIEDVDLKNYLNVKCISSEFERLGSLKCFYYGIIVIGNNTIIMDILIKKDSSPSSFEKKVISRNRVRSDRSHSRRTSIMVDQSGIGILLNYDKEQSILKLTLNRFTIINKIGEQENENIANLKYYIKIKTDHSSIEHCSKLYDLKKTCLKWFKEDFLFSVPEGDYTKDYIYFRVFTHSPLYYDEFIAECDIPIKMVKLGESILLPLYKTDSLDFKKKDNWGFLGEEVCNKASISIAFKYLQLSHRLNVLIMEGRNFDGINISSKSSNIFD
ncbi:hypothetical protein A3Q56_04519 [Intoshia linei]|uniref:C2 domain-containing protein n=1 Tax=Intoshia linei TaxID=1819745 RepID=A0A177B0A3_9BILA|nr:hypothetical protein A3Q56_04519 [Intoshia linei]